MVPNRAIYRELVEQCGKQNKTISQDCKKKKEKGKRKKEKEEEYFCLYIQKKSYLK